jgi:hypothetical protein
MGLGRITGRALEGRGRVSPIGVRKNAYRYGLALFLAAYSALGPFSSQGLALTPCALPFLIT